MQLPQEQESPRRKLSSSSGVAVSLKESDEDSDRSNHSRTSTGSITERTRALITFLEDSLMVEEDDGKKEKDNLSSVVSTGTPPPPFSPSPSYAFDSPVDIMIPTISHRRRCFVYSMSPQKVVVWALLALAPPYSYRHHLFSSSCL